MGLSVETLALSKKFTRDTVIGLGALKGSPCTIKTIEEIEGGNRITFEWTGNDGTTKNTQTLDVLNGVSVENMEINDDAHLICTMTDGRTIDAGKLPAGATTAGNIWVGTTEEYINLPSPLPEDTVVIFTDDGAGGGGGSSSGTAADITYENENYPNLTNVDLALDELISTVFYVEPKITSFNMTPNTTQYEKGQVVNTLSFSWSVNKDIVSQTLSNCTIALDDRTATYTGIISTDKTFTLSVNDGKKSVSASKTIQFFNKAYWGSAAIPAAYDSAFILGLAKNKFATNKKGDYDFNAGTDEYGFFCFPSSMGELTTVNIGGFDVDVVKEDAIQFENASGYVTNYSIYRTGRSGLGAFVATIK